MSNIMEQAGKVIGIAGIALCAVAGVARVSGSYHLGGFQSMTLFDVGVGLMVAACLAYLHGQASRS